MDPLAKILIVSVDRDNDYGRKANIRGPIIGRRENINAAVKLGLADPTDSDVNCTLGAIKKYDELKKKKKNVEIVTLTGHKSADYEADEILNEQIDKVMEKFQPDYFVLVTDGAEDDQVIPILNSRAKILSKDTVIVKQAKSIEQTYYTIKEALRDPFFAGIFFGIPGLIMLLYSIFGELSVKPILFLVGFILLLRGTSFDSKITRGIKDFIANISIHRASFPFYVASGFVIIFGMYAFLQELLTELSSILGTSDLLTQIVKVVGVSQVLYIYLFIAMSVFIVARVMDTIENKKAFLLRKYMLTWIVGLMIWLIVDTGINVISKETDFLFFIAVIFISSLIYFMSYRATDFIDIRKYVTEVFIGLPVYTPTGTWVGKVTEINKDKNSIVFKKPNAKTEKKALKKNFVFKNNKIILLKM